MHAPPPRSRDTAGRPAARRSPLPLAAVGAGDGAVGATVGVEEEYHVVDATTFTLLDSDRLNSAAVHGLLGDRVEAEIATTQLEVATPVCRSLADVRRELATARSVAVGAAATAGATVLAVATHPFASWQEQRLTSRPRYLALLERWGVLALQQVFCGCHVHVGVPDLDTAVAVMDRVTPYLHVVLALTGSSPFHEGVDTGYDSFRSQAWGRWPIAGYPEPFGDAATYRRVVEGLTAAGAVEDSSYLYWDVRPSLRYPTLEYRIGDVCTSLDDAVLHAALVRSLTRVLAARAAAGDPAPVVRPELLRAARWRAARSGVSGELFDPLTHEVVGAREAVARLLGELRADLTAHGEWDEVHALTTQVLARGTSATRQRMLLHRTGDPREVARMLAVEGLAFRGAA
ncbi:glutamate--cysteine ligase [Kineococcus sp. NUM-3379]